MHLKVVITPGVMPVHQVVLAVGKAKSGLLMVGFGAVHGDGWGGPLAIIGLFKEPAPRGLRGTFVGLMAENAPAFDVADPRWMRLPYQHVVEEVRL